MPRPALQPEQRQANMPCAMDECSKSRLARGLCSMHYYRWQMHGDASFTKRRANGREKVIDTPEYKTLHRMLGRCYNERNPKYQDYGGRGITVCDRWTEPSGKGFDNFLKDMGERPGDGYSIDRIDNDGNYEPLNCRWATNSQQTRNRRCTARITAFGRTQTEAEWSRELGILASTIGARRRVYGWTGERLLKPVGATR